jgi:hypothetical protein
VSARPCSPSKRRGPSAKCLRAPRPPWSPPNLQAQNILEIFLYGGVSQYESFYCIDDPAFLDDNAPGWFTFFDSGDVQKAVTKCGIAGPLLQDFAQDASGRMVRFGPYVMPLRERPDVMNRVRVSITHHDLEPHEGAIPLALAGRGLGHPALAGLGSHIQRYFLDRNQVPGRAPLLVRPPLGQPRLPPPTTSAAPPPSASTPAQRVPSASRSTPPATSTPCSRAAPSARTAPLTTRS